MSNFVRSWHDVIGPPKDSLAKVASYQRAVFPIETQFANDSLTALMGWGKIKNDTVTVTDTAFEGEGRAFSQNDTLTGVADTVAKIVAHQRAEAETSTSVDSASRAHAAQRSKDDATAAVTDTITKESAYHKSQDDTITGLIENFLEGDATWRIGADGVNAVDGVTLEMSYGYTRSQDDTATTSDNAVAPHWLGPKIRLSKAEALTGVADDVTEEDGTVRSQADGVTADDNVVESDGHNRSQNDTTAAVTDTITKESVYIKGPVTEAVTTTDTITKASAYNKSSAETVSEADTLAKAVTYERAEDEGTIAADTIVEVDGTVRSKADGVTVADTVVKTSVYNISHAEHVGHLEPRNDGTEGFYWKPNGIYETFTRATTSERAKADAVTNTATGDNVNRPIITYVPASVLLKHVSTKPTYVIQHRDWSHGAFANINDNRGGNLVVLRKGHEEKVLAESFAGWATSAKAAIGAMMAKGVLNVYEHYLGTSRQLTRWQVANYVAVNQPWTTWVQHRVKTGAPVTDDSSPVIINLGTRALSFQRLRVKTTMTGGADPHCSITPWFRDYIEGFGWGTWNAGDVEGFVTSNSEYVITSNHTEVWLQVHSVNGAPTNITTYLSGTT